MYGEDRTDWEKLRFELESERERLGLNKTEFARRLKISQSMYSMFVSGVRPRLGRDTFRAVCDYFGVDPSHWDKPLKEKEPEEIIKLKLVLKSPEILGDKQEMLSVIKNMIEILYKSLPGKRDEV
ncbi:MAG: helix-turn-helix domain-containing protein [Deltaproteobacteria bacterium]|nr:helix-turn-helix domain-containing protein [Deltaproteobacteria bacterium]MBW2081624.1 helix-turn-helix domain-containing protein [Deltaproteobacteria bacterium]